MAIRMMLVIAVTMGCKLLQEWYEFGQWPLLGLLAVSLVALWAGIRFIDLGKQALVWLAIVAGIAIYMIPEWPGPANHTYVYAYLCLVLFLVLRNAPAERTSLLTRNTLYLFNAIMLLAVIQKAITPGYLDGTINAFWLATGGYCEPIYIFFDSWSAVVEHNNAVLNTYYNENPYQTDQIALQAPVSSLRMWGILFSAGILAGEVIVPAIFTWSKSQVFKHTTVLLFLAGVFLTRQETGFLSLLAIMALTHCPPEHTRIRGIYLLLFAFMQTLFVLDFGYI